MTVNDAMRLERRNDWATVGDPGNAADTTGYGAAAASFRIMKYEFMSPQYTTS